MRVIFLAVLFFVTFLVTSLVTAHAAAAQEASEFSWSTSVIHRLAEPAEFQAAASPQPPTAAGISFDEYLPGSAVAVEFRPGIEQLIEAGRKADIHVVAEVSPETTAIRDAAKALHSGISGFIVRGGPTESAAFRERLAPLIKSDLPLRIIADSSSVGDIVEPPREIIQPKSDWEALFAATDATKIIRIRVDEWAAPLVRTLLLMRGGLYVEGRLGTTARAIEAFRLRHPAVATGEHEQLVNSVYTFRRSLDGTDEVVVVLGAEGKTSINVSRVFPDDTLLQDAVTGRTAFVSFGMATFEADSSGIILIEEIR